DAPRPARLAGRRVPGKRLGRQARHPADGHFGDLPPILQGDGTAETGRPVQPAAGPAGAVPPRRRGGARQRPGGERPAGAAGGGAEGRTVPTAPGLGAPEFSPARGAGASRRRAGPPRGGAPTVAGPPPPAPPGPARPPPRARG